MLSKYSHFACYDIASPVHGFDDSLHGGCDTLGRDLEEKEYILIVIVVRHQLIFPPTCCLHARRDGVDARRHAQEVQRLALLPDGVLSVYPRHFHIPLLRNYSLSFAATYLSLQCLICAMKKYLFNGFLQLGLLQFLLLINET